MILLLGCVGVGKDAAPAAHIEYPFALQRSQAIDPVQPERIDLVKRPKLAFGIPPTVG